jgi:SAM-dependent methyltransferase
LKYLCEGILFYPEVLESLTSTYSFTGMCHGLYRRFRNFFEKYFCNTINTELLFSPLLSVCYNDVTTQYNMQKQWCKTSFEIQKKLCTNDYRYPACLSQLRYLLDKGAERDLTTLINKIIRGVNDRELKNIYNTLTDDLVAYNQLFVINKNIMSKKSSREENIFEVNEIRGQARIKELKDVLTFLRNVVTKEGDDFRYLDYGGSDGAITASLAKFLRLRKFQAFSVDVETWFGSEYPQPYKNEITYKIIKPNTSLAMENESVDVITCFQVLHHVQDLDYTVRDLVKKLKTGGMFIIREHDCNDAVTRVLIDVEHSLFEVVKKETVELNAGYLFETIDSDKYKSISAWTSYLRGHGLELMDEFKKLHNESPKGVTRYTYRVYKKM